MSKEKPTKKEAEEAGGIMGTPPVEPKQEPKPRTGLTIEVSKDALESLIARVGKQEAEIKKLTDIADKGRMAHWNTTHKVASSKNYLLSTLNGKVITSWEMKSNLVWKDGGEMGEWREKQEIEVTLEDESKVLLPYVKFTTDTKKVPVKLISTTQKGGQTIFEVEAENGTKYIIDSIFVN